MQNNCVDNSVKKLENPPASKNKMEHLDDKVPQKNGTFSSLIPKVQHSKPPNILDQKDEEEIRKENKSVEPEITRNKNDHEKKKPKSGKATLLKRPFPNRKIIYKSIGDSLWKEGVVLNHKFVDNDL